MIQIRFDKEKFPFYQVTQGNDMHKKGTEMMSMLLFLCTLRCMY